MHTEVDWKKRSYALIVCALRSSFEAAFVLWRVKLYVPAVALEAKPEEFLGSQDFVRRNAGEGEPKSREGSGEGRCRDGYDRMALKATITLPTNKLSSDRQRISPPPDEETWSRSKYPG